jgi:hypothetical protein
VAKLPSDVVGRLITQNLVASGSERVIRLTVVYA